MKREYSAAFLSNLLLILGFFLYPSCCSPIFNTTSDVDDFTVQTSTASSIKPSMPPISLETTPMLTAQSAIDLLLEHLHSIKETMEESSSADPSASSLELIDPLLKQLSPVGVGLGAILAPFLLFNGIMSFFGNINKYLNNFVQTILPIRRPQRQGQNQGQVQNQGVTSTSSKLKRQPRSWRLREKRSSPEIDDLVRRVMRALESFSE